MLPWAITRAKDDADRVCEALRRAGVNAFALPCIERIRRPVDPWRPPGHRVMFVTSAAVAETAADMLASAEPHDVAALRPATAAALASRHVPVSITAERGAHPLALEVSHALSTRGIRSASIWYPTSDLAEERDEHHEALGVLRALGSVTRVVAYETRAPKALASDMERLPSAYGVVFASPSAVEHFVRAAADSPVPQRVVCWGASTLKAALPFFSGAVEASRERHLFETLKTQEAHHG